MTPSRQVAVTALAALFGLAAAVALAVVLSGVTAQHVALTGQPLHEGDRLAVARPRATREAARPRRPAASPIAAAPRPRAPRRPRPPPPPPPTATATAPPADHDRHRAAADDDDAPGPPPGTTARPARAAAPSATAGAATTDGPPRTPHQRSTRTPAAPQAV